MYKICEYCHKEYKINKNSQRFCSNLCAYKNLTEEQIENNHHRNMGLKSVQSQNKRSKNEIAFAELCKNNFNNVLFNSPIFNGCDADIILENENCYIME